MSYQAEIKLIPVDVYILDLSWIDKDMKSLFKVMKTNFGTATYDRMITRMLFTQQNYTQQLMLKVMLPQILLTITSQFYFNEAIRNYD